MCSLIIVVLALFIAPIWNYSYSVSSSGRDITLWDYCKNCTVKSHLPCNIVEYNTVCPITTVAHSGDVPTPPRNLIAEVVKRKSNHNLRITFSIPTSFKSLNGFEISIRPLRHGAVNQERCILLNLTEARWQDGDLGDGFRTNPVEFEYGCFSVDLHVKYHVAVCSLPKQLTLIKCASIITAIDKATAEINAPGKNESIKKRESPKRERGIPPDAISVNVTCERQVIVAFPPYGRFEFYEVFLNINHTTVHGEYKKIVPRNNTTTMFERVYPGKYHISILPKPVVACPIDIYSGERGCFKSKSMLFSVDDLGSSSCVPPIRDPPFAIVLCAVLPASALGIICAIVYRFYWRKKCIAVVHAEEHQTEKYEIVKEFYGLLSHLSFGYELLLFDMANVKDWKHHLYDDTRIILFDSPNLQELYRTHKSGFIHPLFQLRSSRRKKRIALCSSNTVSSCSYNEIYPPFCAVDVFDIIYYLCGERTAYVIEPKLQKCDLYKSFSAKYGQTTKLTFNPPSIVSLYFSPPDSSVESDEDYNIQ